MLEQTEFIHLLRKMGHDMRVPLNTLISTSDMLADGMYDPLTTKQARAAVRLQRNSHRLLAILDDFVSYVKAEGRDLDLNPQPFAPRSQLEAWCEPIRNASLEKGLGFRLETSEAVPAMLKGDETALKRILQALLWNALAHTTQGEIVIRSDWLAEQGWQINVQDSGSGIPEADLPHIFEPFWRGVERPQLPTAAAGLGLPLARALARLMAGELSLKESSPSGSLFNLSLPLEACPPEKDL